jgi:hypothetical protein
MRRTHPRRPQRTPRAATRREPPYRERRPTGESFEASRGTRSSRAPRSRTRPSRPSYTAEKIRNCLHRVASGSDRHEIGPRWDISLGMEANESRQAPQNPHVARNESGVRTAQPLTRANAGGGGPAPPMFFDPGVFPRCLRIDVVSTQTLRVYELGRKAALFVPQPDRSV